MKKAFIVRRSITMVEGKPHVETYSEQELVLCKDCKYYDGNGTCMKNGIAFLTDRWFCADGEGRRNHERTESACAIID